VPAWPVDVSRDYSKVKVGLKGRQRKIGRRGEGGREAELKEEEKRRRAKGREEEEEEKTRARVGKMT